MSELPHRFDVTGHAVVLGREHTHSGVGIAKQQLE
jgi:hypothetical protein